MEKFIFHVELVRATGRCVHVLIIVAYYRRWLFLGIYAYPQCYCSKIIWNEIRKVSTFNTLPWVLVGDFNCLVYPEEKHRGVPPNTHQLHERSYVIGYFSPNDLGFIEAPMHRQSVVQALV